MRSKKTLTKRKNSSPGLIRSTRASLQSFTYFIPAPARAFKSGYREKEFDQILSGILSIGFKLESLHTTCLSQSEGGGMWVICLLRASTKQAKNFDLELYQNFSLSELAPHPDISYE